MGNKKSKQIEKEPSKESEISMNIEQLRHSCDLCGKSINTVRYYCIYCDVDCNSFDICENCFKEKKHTESHPLTEIPSTLSNTIEYYNNCAEALENRLVVFKEKRLFGILKNKKDAKSGDKPICLEYLTDEEIKELKLRKIHIGNSEEEEKGIEEDEEYIKFSKNYYYEWRNTGECYDLARSLATGLLNKIELKSFVGILSENSVMWYIADFSCIFGGFVSVPIHYSFTSKQLAFIINQSKLKVVFSSKQQLEKLFKVVDECPVLEYIVYMEEDPQESKESILESYKDLCNFDKIKFLFVKELLVDKENWKPIQKKEKTDIATLIYTSGSTGMPKGAIITDTMLNKEIGSNESFLIRSHSLVSFIFAPLSWATARKSSYASISHGGRITIWTGNMETFYHEARLTAPSYFGGPPRIWNTLYAEYKSLLSNRLEQYRNSKKDNPEINPITIERGLLRRFSKCLGHRVRSVSTGGAKTPPKVYKWMQKCFNCLISEGFGITEVGSVASNGIRRHEALIKLQDVVEMGYTALDKPYMRGLLWVKTPEMSPGYYGDEENTKNNYDSDGYFNTGDIVEYCPTTNHLKVIDRLKNIVKLAQSVFVAPEYLETTFVQNRFIESIYIDANINQSYVLGVIIPNKSACVCWFKLSFPEYKLEGHESDNVTQKDWEYILYQSKLKDTILKELRELGKREELQNFEIPRDLYFEINIPWTAENGLLTPSMKLKRTGLSQKYEEVLSEMYKNINEVKIDKNNENLSQNTQEYIFNLICETMGITKDDNLLSMTVAEIGIDSISIVRLISELQNKYNIKLPVGTLFSRTVKEISDLILQFCDNKEVSSLLNEDNKIKIDWDEEVSVPENTTLLYNSASPYKSKKEQNVIFLTGANGFLGAFLLRDILLKENYCKKVYCLVRGQNEENATKRLQENYHFYFRENFSDDRIQVLCGDLGKIKFGLNDEMWQDICKEVDIVYHNGAQINGVLPYSVLRLANLVGTKQILDLCVTSQVKLLVYVSTLSVFTFSMGMQKEEQVFTKDVLPNMSSYGGSKRAAEIVLQNFLKSNPTFPLLVFRCGTIAGDSKLGGCNNRDFINKFIQGIIQCGKAPSIGNEQRLTMIPVDWVSENIIHISTEKLEEGLKLRNFHIFNDSQKCFKMRDLVNYINSFGYSLETTPYENWKEFLSTFKDEKENVLYPLQSYFRGPIFPSHSDDSHFEKTNLVALQSRDPPEITSRLLYSWIQFFQKCEIISLATL